MGLERPLEEGREAAVQKAAPADLERLGARLTQEGREAAVQ